MQGIRRYLLSGVSKQGMNAAWWGAGGVQQQSAPRQQHEKRHQRAWTLRELQVAGCSQSSRKSDCQITEAWCASLKNLALNLEGDGLASEGFISETGFVTMCRLLWKRLKLKAGMGATVLLQVRDDGEWRII